MKWRGLEHNKSQPVIHLVYHLRLTLSCVFFLFSSYVLFFVFFFFLSLRCSCFCSRLSHNTLTFSPSFSSNQTFELLLMFLSKFSSSYGFFSSPYLVSSFHYTHALSLSLLLTLSFSLSPFVRWCRRAGRWSRSVASPWALTATPPTRLSRFAPSPRPTTTTTHQVRLAAITLHLVPLLARNSDPIFNRIGA